MPCIRCGECARVCPAVLLATATALAGLPTSQWDDAEEYGLFDCIECGCCDFVCPSQIPLVEWFRYGKGPKCASAPVERPHRDQGKAAVRSSARHRLEDIKNSRKQRIAEKKQAAEGDPPRASRKKLKKPGARKAAASARKNNRVIPHDRQPREFETGGAPHFLTTRHRATGDAQVVLIALSARHRGLRHWYFGPGILVPDRPGSVYLCPGIFEALMLKSGGKRPGRLHLTDLSAVVTAVLFALCLPPLAPWWIACIGHVFRHRVAKQLIWRTGSQHVFNPAMIAYVVCLVSFPRAMTLWLPPISTGKHSPWISWTTVPWAPYFTGNLPGTPFLGRRHPGHTAGHDQAQAVWERTDHFGNSQRTRFLATLAGWAGNGSPTGLPWAGCGCCGAG